ncbi:uncharacterized protein K02A2.6-like [Cydia strobilella]|uniref:uncharacterized protein K02A2.6-like n=1 Tax=Cydia strobilella TaxID=1100964 RepID=UPI0030058891
MNENQKPDLSALKEFKMNVDVWSTYVSRLKAWFTIQDVKVVDFSKYLVAVVGTEPLDLIIDLCYPETPEKVGFDKIVTLVEEHLSPKRSIIAERMIFRACKQVEGQTISEYLVQLKKLSKHCKFSDNNILKENIRDQFVYGLLSERIRQRMLTEDDDLTLKRATELALSLEAAVRDSKSAGLAQQPAAASGNRSEAEPVFAVSGGGAPRQRGGGGSGARARGSRHRPQRRGYGDYGRGGSTSSGGQCYRCDGRHPEQQCSFKNSECYVCGDVGHIAKMCRFRKNPKQVHRVITEGIDGLQSDESESEDGPLQVYQLSDADAEPDTKWMVKVNVNNVLLIMEGDTGSAISVISFSIYKEHFGNCKLYPYESNLTMYSGQKVKPKGIIICTVQLGNQTVHGLKLVVYDNNSSPPLLGRNWLRAFGIEFPRINDNNNVNSVNVKVSSENICTKLIKLFPNVFADGIGTFNKTKLRLDINSDVTPVWRRPRPVPIALRPAVETELERLQREGIISPVEWSDWGTPVVPVIKKNGDVRLCGDFKTTVNPVLVDDKYPIPRIDDIFSSLQGGKYFSKIDLSQAPA